MKKSDFKKLALLGLTGGVLLSSQGAIAEEQESSTVAANYGANNGCGASDSSTPTAHTGKLNEEQLLKQLNDDGRKIYKGLDPKGKELALKLANADCKGKNDCKAQGSCKNGDNACAAQNSCKGKTPGPFRDKNQAVKAAAKVMADKRAQAKG